VRISRRHGPIKPGSDGRDRLSEFLRGPELQRRADHFAKLVARVTADGTGQPTNLPPLPAGAPHYEVLQIPAPEDGSPVIIYVLRSKSDNPVVTANREILHKIGVTGGKVEARIANAKLDPTFLLADVEVVATYELYNINRVKLENLIHRVSIPRSSTSKSRTASATLSVLANGSWSRSLLSTKPSRASERGRSRSIITTLRQRASSSRARRSSSEG
jgi:hypothetical protein